MISKGREQFENISMSDIYQKVSDVDMLSYYLNIKKIPCLIKSPLRVDHKPSFSLYSKDKVHVIYKDFSTGEHGNVFGLLMSYFNKSFKEVLQMVANDFGLVKYNNEIKRVHKKPERVKCIISESTKLECKIRDWTDYDIEYWKSYGISLEWLKYADIYPISHQIVIKGDERYVFPADKYAYAYAEFKDNKVTIKIYQPFNTNGFKWLSNHDKSVISLWTKIPEKGDKLCICSSMKDALCLWINIGIPCLAVQGEGYLMSETAINNLKSRYQYIYVLFDNDKAGLIDGEKFSQYTGFKNVILPNVDNCKDVSDLFKHVGKEQFILILKNLFL